MMAAIARSRLGFLGASLLLALGGCSQQAKPPTAPAPGPPELEAVHPAARSTGVFYDTDIWARFSEPLDPASANERTIFLKLDTVRIPIGITYDVPSRTLRLVTLARLALLRTYTVEITSGVKTAAGQPLSPTFWQFRTNGLRRLDQPTPAESTSGESPFALLKWGDQEPPSAGTIVYTVYAGADSAAVAARSLAPMYNGLLPYMLTPSPWGTDSRVYWSVTSVNQTSNERLDGPVWSFATLPATTPVDSIFIYGTEWGDYNTQTQSVECLADFFWAGPRYTDGFHWPLPALKLAGARIKVETANQNPVSGQPTVWPVKQPWPSCSYSPASPTLETAKVADAERLGLTQYALFESNPLTSCLEAGGRYGIFYGFSFKAGVNQSYLAFQGHGPLLTLYYYRTSSSGPAAHVP